MSYTDVKRELKSRRENTRYFDREFFKTFKKCLRARRAALEDGGEEYAEILPGVVGLPSYKDVYKTRFYRENGAAYCEFLAIVQGVL